jgi:hypothetical protein
LQTKDAHTNPTPLGHIYRNISLPSSEKRVKVIVRTSRKSRKNRATPHHENDQESALPKPKKPSDQNEISRGGGRLTNRNKRSAPFSTEKVQRDLASIAAVEQEEIEALRKWCEGSIAEMVSGKNAAQCQSRSRD